MLVIHHPENYDEITSNKMNAFYGSSSYKTFNIVSLQTQLSVFLADYITMQNLVITMQNVWI